MSKSLKTGGMNELPKESNEWMLHTPGGGPLESRCPCLPLDICPRVFGHSPLDILLLGHLPICTDESKVRCCGASFSITTGFVSTEVNDAMVVKTDTTEHTNSSNNIVFGVSKDASDGTLSPPLKKYSEDNDTEDLIDIVETTEESPTTLDALQDIEDQTVRTLTDAYIGETLTGMNHSFNQSENPDTVYIENLRPDVLLFQDTKGFIQEYEGRDIMVVTPIPLTPRAKYQQQLSTGDDQLSFESDPSYIHTKDVTYVTHRPDGEVMVVTPLSVEEEKLITQLSLPPEMESRNKSNLPTQDEQPDVKNDIGLNNKPSAITQVEGLTENITPGFSSDSLTEERREKHLTGIDLKPNYMENPRVIDSTALTGQGMTTTIIESNTGNVPKEIHHVMALVNATQNFANSQGNVGKGFGVEQMTIRNSKRPTKTRVTARPTWSPQRIRTRKPENLGSRHLPQQGANLEVIKGFLRPEDVQDISNMDKPILTRSVGNVAQGKGNRNTILQDLPSSTSVKYVPVAMNKINQIKLQSMLVSPLPVRIPNTSADQQHDLALWQTTPFYRLINQNKEATLYGAKIAMNEEFLKRGVDIQEVLRRKQEMDSLHQGLSSPDASFRHWLMKNADVAQSERVNNENQPVKSLHVKVGQLDPSQQFHTHDNLNLYKYHDEIFGAKIISNQ